MRSGRGFSLFELMLVTLIISAVVVVAANFYASMARDVRRLGLEVAGHHFATAIMAVRAQWYLEPERTYAEGALLHDVLALPPDIVAEPGSNRRIYINRQGWPVATEEDATARTGNVSAQHCLQLWQGLLKSSVSVSLESDEHTDYQVAWLDGGQCRYRLRDEEPYYFDYTPETGEVRINRPDTTKE